MGVPCRGREWISIRRGRGAQMEGEMWESREGKSGEMQMGRWDWESGRVGEWCRFHQDI